MTVAMATITAASVLFIPKADNSPRSGESLIVDSNKERGYCFSTREAACPKSLLKNSSYAASDGLFPLELAQRRE